MWMWKRHWIKTWRTGTKTASKARLRRLTSLRSHKLFYGKKLDVIIQFLILFSVVAPMKGLIELQNERKKRTYGTIRFRRHIFEHFFGCS